jgi:hypothetical protein
MYFASEVVKQPRRIVFTPHTTFLALLVFHCEHCENIAAIAFVVACFLRALCIEGFCLCLSSSLAISTP